MTEEQAKLVLAIVSRLDEGAVHGEWPHEACSYCSGASDGYYDSRGFTHRPECIVPLIEQLRRTQYSAEL